MTNDFEGLGKLDPLQIKSMGKRMYVKDADMQLHVPMTGDPRSLEETHSFKNVLGRYLDDVNTLQHDKEAEIQRLVAGETEDLHRVTLKMDEAEAAFDMMMEIRNKLLDAYQELIRMQ
jgi:flagellar hook-basal body complex protein FliE